MGLPHGRKELTYRLLQVVFQRWFSSNVIMMLPLIEPGKNSGLSVKLYVVDFSSVVPSRSISALLLKILFFMVSSICLSTGAQKYSMGRRSRDK